MLFTLFTSKDIFCTRGRVYDALCEFLIFSVDEDISGNTTKGKRKIMAECTAVPYARSGDQAGDTGEGKTEVAKGRFPGGRRRVSSARAEERLR